MIDYSKDYYKILLINDNASEKQIKEAYRYLIKKFHPDNNVNETENNKKLAEARFKEIEEAYEVLSNINTKTDYDLSRKSSNTYRYNDSYQSNYRSYQYESSRRKSARESAQSWNSKSEEEFNAKTQYTSNYSNLHNSDGGCAVFLVILSLIVILFALLKSCGNNNNYTSNTNYYAKNGWIEENNNLSYFINNEKVKNKWEKFNNVWVHLNNDGILDKNKWVDEYYVNADGIMLINSWLSYNNNLYYVDNTGKYVHDNFVDYGGDRFYVDSTGAMKRNSWVNYNGQWYHVGYDGKMQKNIYIYDGLEQYYLDKNGIATKTMSNILDNFNNRLDNNVNPNKIAQENNANENNIIQENTILDKYAPIYYSNNIDDNNSKSISRNNSFYDDGETEYVNYNNYNDIEEEYDITKYKYTVNDDYPKFVSTSHKITTQ